MTLDKFTIKAQEAVQQAVNTAQLNGQQVIEPVHILKGILEKAKDVTNFIFQKLGVNAQQIELLVEQEIKHLPKVQGGQPYLSHDSNNVLVRAQETAQKMGDEFVSVEPVLLALLDVNSTASRIMKDAGCTEKEMLQAIQTIRTRNTDGISLPGFISMAIGCAAFVVQGFLIENYYLVLTNLITCTCSVIIFAIKMKNDYGKKR